MARGQSLGSPFPVVPLIGGRNIPAHVVGRETIGKETRFHAFLWIADRDAWIDEDPGTRESWNMNCPRVLAAWKAFAVTLHKDERASKRLKLC